MEIRSLREQQQHIVSSADRRVGSPFRRAQRGPIVSRLLTVDWLSVPNYGLLISTLDTEILQRKTVFESDGSGKWNWILNRISSCDVASRSTKSS